MRTPKTIIAEALDEFDVEDFVDVDFEAICADKIIAELEWNNYRIVKVERKAGEPDASSVTSNLREGK